MKGWNGQDLKDKGYHGFDNKNGIAKKLSNMCGTPPKNVKEKKEVIFKPNATPLVKILRKPLSVNTAWKGHRYRSDEYKSYQKALDYMLPEITLPEPPYELYFKFGFSSASSDFDNPIKPTLDCIAKKYKFNDKLIKRAVIEIGSVEKGKEFFEFSLTHYPKK